MHRRQQTNFTDSSTDCCWSGIGYRNLDASTNRQQNLCASWILEWLSSDGKPHESYETHIGLPSQLKEDVFRFPHEYSIPRFEFNFLSPNGLTFRGAFPGTVAIFSTHTLSFSLCLSLSLSICISYALYEGPFFYCRNGPTGCLGFISP